MKSSDGSSVYAGFVISAGSYDASTGTVKSGGNVFVATIVGNSVYTTRVSAGTVGNCVNVYVGKAVGTALNVGYGLIDGSGGTE